MRSNSRPDVTSLGTVRTRRRWRRSRCGIHCPGRARYGSKTRQSPPRSGAVSSRTAWTVSRQAGAGDGRPFPAAGCPRTTGPGKAQCCWSPLVSAGVWPAAVVSLSAAPRQFGGQTDLISQKTRRDGPGVRDHPDTISSNGQTSRPRSTLHLPSAFCWRTWNLRQVPVSPAQEALRSIFAQRSADPRESPGLAPLIHGPV